MHTAYRSGRRATRVDIGDGVSSAAAETGCVGALQDTAGDIRHTVLGQNDHSGQTVLHMPTLAVVVNQGAANRRVVADHRRRYPYGQFHHTLPCPGRRIQLGPKVAR